MSPKVKVILYKRENGCPPCTKLTPIWKKLCELYKDNEDIIFETFIFENEAHKKIFAEKKIRSVPTIFIKDYENKTKYEIKNYQKLFEDAEKFGILKVLYELREEAQKKSNG